MASSKSGVIKKRSVNASYDAFNKYDDDKYNKTNKKSTFPWFRLTVTTVVILGCLYLIIWSRYGYELNDANVTEMKKEIIALRQELNQYKKEAVSGESLKKEPGEDDTSKTYFWNNLPSSDVWCRGQRRFDRICRIRNLCYHPKHKEWFIVKTSKSVLQNVPFNETEYLFIELNTVEGHNKFFWSYSEVSPYNPKFQNINMRYETRPHFMFSRLHPNNIMHNLHDDALGLFFTIKEFAPASNNSMSFDKGHRLMIMDEFGETESSRHFHYFTEYPLRFRKYVESSDTITCFKDAVLGNNKIATFYQYGFFTPQGKIQNKDLNGMYIREVATMIYRRLGIANSFDENELEAPTKRDKSELFGTKLSAMDLKETDLIIIFVRKKNRLILNEEELAAALKKKYGLEVVLVSNEEHSFEQQIRFMRRARVLMGMHGSILVMTMFCRRGTVVVELFPFGVPSQNYTPYKTIAELPGMELVYRKWENKDEDATIGYPNRGELNGGIKHLPKEEQEKVLSTKTVPEHLCCTSPYWLYRIYQDTKVNVKEVLEIIDDGLMFSRDNILKKLHEANYFEASFIKPASVNAGKCIEDSRRKPDQLWMSWDYPWNGAPVSQFNLQVNGVEYLTKGNASSIIVPNLPPNSTIKVAIRPLAPGYKGFWGNLIYCKI